MSTSMNLDELAKRIGAQVIGSGAAAVSGCAGLDEATPQQLSFLANRKYVAQLRQSKAAAVCLSAEDAQLPEARGKTLLVCDDPCFAFRNAVVALHGFRVHAAPGISPQAFVDESAVVDDLCTIRPFVYIAPRARIGKRCIIYPHCYIGKDAVLADDCILYPHVTVYNGCMVGRRVILHAGCAVGADGFGYATHEGVHHKTPQVGNAVIEDDVELGANTVIQRAALGSTRVGAGTKISDLVAIGHGANIGPGNLLVAQAGVAGSTVTGSHVVMGGQAGVAGHLTIGDRVQIAGQAGVIGDLQADGKYGGSPAIPLAEAKRLFANVLRATDLSNRVRELEQRLEKLEAEREATPGRD